MQKIITVLPDAMVVAGSTAISFGAWLLHPSAGLVTGGLLAIAGGLMAARKLASTVAE